MKLNINHKKCSVYIAILLILITGCDRYISPTPIVSFTTITHTVEIYKPSITPSPTKKSSPTQTASRTLWLTSTDLPPTPTITLTQTPRPTLPVVEAKSLILELLKTNGGCKYPCWWGITPGLSLWNETQGYLNTFASQIIQSSSIGNTKIYQAEFTVPSYIRQNGIYRVYFYENQNGMVEQIQFSINYSLSKILIDYGKPEEIWIYGVSYLTIMPYAEYIIALFYPSQGLIVVYDAKTSKGEIIKICPSKTENSAYIILWSPLEQKTFKEIADPIILGAPPFQISFFPLELATNLSINDFYMTYKNENSSWICFDMPDPDLR